jgi:hypothetical protein
MRFIGDKSIQEIVCLYIVMPIINNYLWVDNRYRIVVMVGNMYYIVFPSRLKKYAS